MEQRTTEGDYDKVKLKYIRANDGPFMNKELRKEIIIRSNLNILGLTMDLS